VRSPVGDECGRGAAVTWFAPAGWCISCESIFVDVQLWNDGRADRC
jgi:hypothetical protein